LQSVGNRYLSTRWAFWCVIVNMSWKNDSFVGELPGLAAGT